ncbi:MAG: HNH endonuclease signature motif containing protein [Rubrivivax sp.]
MNGNRTEIALIARGMPSDQAAHLRSRGWTAAKLQAATDAELNALGISDAVKRNLRAGARPAIPSDTLSQVLYANRWACCVCRTPGLPVIVHHIEPWAKTHDHTAGNLAVLCAVHHGEAHSTRDLQISLTAARLRDFKQRWEEQAGRDDAQAIQLGTQLQSDQWIYFNHLRLAELARANGVDLAALPGRVQAERFGVCNDDGDITVTAPNDGYIYDGSHGIALYRYSKAMLYELLNCTAIRNISNDLDRGPLKAVVVPGDLIYVQGRHIFEDVQPAPANAQAVRARRSANRVEINFDFDRREATSTSAWTGWLRGAQDIGSLVQVKMLKRVSNGKLHIIGTVIGMRNALEGLKTRTYEAGLYKAGLIRTFGSWDDEESDDLYERDDTDGE